MRVLGPLASRTALGHWKTWDGLENSSQMALNPRSREDDNPCGTVVVGTIRTVCPVLRRRWAGRRRSRPPPTFSRPSFRPGSLP